VGLKLFCFYGSEEDDTLCPKLSPELATVIERPGGHRIGREVEFIAEKILEAIEAP